MANRILFINPFKGEIFDQPIKAFIEKEKRSDTDVEVVSLKRGPEHLEYHYYEALTLVDTLKTIKHAEKEGYDAAVIGCFYDPGLREAREITNSIVITAPAEAAMHIATTLGHQFSIIVGREKWIRFSSGRGGDRQAIEGSGQRGCGTRSSRGGHPRLYHPVWVLQRTARIPWCSGHRCHSCCVQVRGVSHRTTEAI